MQQRKLNCYECEDEGCDLSNGLYPLVCKDAVMCWKSTAREADGKQTSSRGCITNRDQVLFYCNMHLHSSNRFGTFHTQCCQENLCNSGPFPLLQNPADADLANTIKLIIAMLGPIIGLFLMICGMYVYHRNKNGSMVPAQNKNFVESDMESANPAISSSASTTGGNISCSHEIQAIACGDSTIKDYMQGQSLTSGSGAGLPILVQRTLAQQVTLVACLNSSGGNGGNDGKFGRQIWRGIWHGENVAVKIYFSRDEAMWTRETEVYSHLLPSRHDNILGYVGSDMISQASCTQLWLVIHYHKPGSLHNYLGRLSQPLNHHQLLDICLSIVNGLLYLHTEIHGTQGKPSMAHRNLSSKSIIVKANGICVIADLAYVVTHDRLMDKMDFKQISKRYMSPELLEQTFDPQSLESFRLADIYSLGLVFWEVCRCCSSNGVFLKYAAPYSEWLVNGDQEPTLEEMKNLVITDQRRPSVPNHWHSDPTLKIMEAMIEECWYTKASSRLPILRVKKNLGKIAVDNTHLNLSLY